MGKPTAEDSAALPPAAAAVLARDRISTGAEDGRGRTGWLLQSTLRPRCDGRANGQE